MAAVCSCFRCTHPQFFGAFQIVAPLEDTCVEIYRVNGDDFQLENEQYLDATFDTLTYVSSVRTVGRGESRGKLVAE